MELFPLELQLLGIFRLARFSSGGFLECGILHLWASGTWFSKLLDLEWRSIVLLGDGGNFGSHFGDLVVLALRNHRTLGIRS